MQATGSRRILLGTMLILGVTIGCNKSNSGPDTARASSDSGKIPITTKSDEAKKEFLQGRALADKLLAQDSLAHFDRAISLDPEFASAELARANASGVAKEFFEHQQRAMSLADKASDGEKLLILANQAGANGEAAKQKDYLEKLVSEYPNDERAHFALGGYYFGQQEFGQAVEHYRKATEIAPNYSPAYNILGYAYRQQRDYPSAEQAFKKYVELIPNDPNPYDSYAELLLTMGKFDESIAQYRKALSVDRHFVASHFGISADLTYMGKPQEATAELQQIIDGARNDGETRLALFGMAVVAADSGEMDHAVQQIEREYAVAEKTSDAASMAADLQAKGNILLAAGKFDEAKKTFEASLEKTESSQLSDEIKQNAKLQHHFNLTLVAVGKKDLNTAKSQAEEFRKGAEASGNSAQVKQVHELAGAIALAQKNYDSSIAELEQANQQNPRNLFRLYEAYQAKGNSAKATEYLTKVVTLNPLPQLNYAFIRAKAQKAAGNKKA